MKLRLAPDFGLPLEAVTESLAMLATRRSGKSNTAKVLAEGLHAAGQQIVIVDPKGDWWGIRSSADGKRPGLPIVIVGGEYGDVPLEVNGGELVAKMVVEQRVSLLIDLSGCRKREIPVFMTGFLETLYRLKAQDRYRTAMMLIIDEADAIAPQRPDDGEQRMLGAAEDIVRRGGQRGIGITLISQRAAVLNKNVLTQCGVLILLRTIGSQDIDAVDEWIKKHGQPEKRGQVMAELASLPRGTAFVWAPGWPDERGIFKRITVDLTSTFDSGATPKPGQALKAPKTLADVDLAAFRSDMAATIERAKAEDPKLLRARIAELERAVKSKSVPVATPPAKVETKIVEKPVITDRQIAGLTHLVDVVGTRREAETKRWDLLLHSLSGLLGEAQRINQVPRVSAPVSRVSAQPTPRPPTTSRVSDRRVGTAVDRGNGASIGKGERVVLIAIAQHAAGVTREQLTVLTGYARSSRNSYLQRLSAAGLIDAGERDILATEHGLQFLGADFEPLPTGDALREHWLQELPEGERRILELLVASYPDPVDREKLSEVTGYARSSRNSYLQRLGARRLVVSARGGEPRASEMLFG